MVLRLLNLAGMRCVVFAGFLIWTSIAQAQLAVPPLKAAVTDLTGTRSTAQAQQLDARLQEFSRARGSQVAVLIVATIKPEAIEQFSIRVAEAWKIGRGGKDDGVILVVAKDDRTLRLEVGNGLKGAIPDVVAKRIIDETIVPRFRDGDFAGGVTAGLTTAMKLIEGEKLPPPVQRDALNRDAGPDPNAFFAVFVVLLAASTLLNSLFGRLGGSTLSGGVVGIAASPLFGSIVVGVLAAVTGLLFALFRGVPSRGHYGGGRFGGGGGGFGGGFGGGGASGRW